MSAPAHDDSPWVARLATSLAASLDPLRLVPGLEGLLAGNWIWVKGGPLSETEQALMTSVPWFNRFTPDREGWLLESGKALPWGRIQDGPWRRLAELLVPLAPPASFRGELRNRALLEMRRSDDASPAALLMVPAQEWHDYAQQASGLRLERLSFVLNEARGLALIRGEPLPALQGRRYYFHGPAAIPCGFAPYPALQPATFTSWLELKEGETALFDEDGTYARIGADLWRHAGRSTVRENCAPLHR